MRPIYSTGDKVYLPEEEDDFNDYEIVEISKDDDLTTSETTGKYRYKIRVVKGDKTVIKGESEIYPITFV